MHKIIIALVACLLWCNICGILAQEGDDLVVEMLYDMAPSIDAQNALQGLMQHNGTGYIFTQLSPELIIFNLSEINNDLQPGTLNITKIRIDTQSLVQVSTGFIDTNNSVVYIGGAERVFRVDTKNSSVSSIVLGSLTFSAQTSFVDVEARLGYFVSSTEPGILVLPLDQFNASLTRYIDTRSDRMYTSAYDPVAKRVYIGTYGGLLEVVDVANNESLYLYSAPDLRYQVILHDPEHGTVYACGSHEQTKISFISIFTDTLTFLGNVNIPELQDDCNTGILDLARGQGFFAFYESSSSMVLSINLPQRNTPTYAFVLADNSLMVGTYIVPANRSLILVSNSQICLLGYTSSCPEDCSNHGVCNYGNCTCDNDWYGLACNQRRCLNDCLSRGTCSQGICYCNVNYTGADCSTRQCPGQCSTHGTCSGPPDYLCSCTDGWSGIDCSISPPAPPPPECPTITDAEACVSRTYCGWCGDGNSGNCRAGNINGPVYGACIEWNYNQNPEIGVIVIAIVFLVVLGLMFILDIISAIRVDFKRAADLKLEYSTGVARKPTVQEAAALWWRDQRSAKAWTLFEQFQFFALFTHFAMTYPTRIQSLIRFLNWTNIGIPLPFMQDTTVHDNRRTLLGLVQYGNGLDLLPEDLFAANMFWFAMGLFAIVIVIGALALLLYTRAHWRTVVVCRLVYVLMRFLSVAYMGIVMTSSYTLVGSPHNYRTIVPAVFTLIIIGGGYPFLIHKLLDGKTKQLFENEFKFKFGSLYVNYRPEHSKFYLTNIGRRFVTGFLVGILAFSAENEPMWVVWFQVTTLGIAQVAYAYRLFRSKPYYDQYHEYLDYFLVIVNVGTIALSMLHYNEPSVAGELITALVQALGFIACIGAYMVSWMQMNSKFLRKIMSCFSRKKETDSAIPLDSAGTANSGI